MSECQSTYTDGDGVTYECAGISCPISEWLGFPLTHKAWAVEVEWKDEEADQPSDVETSR